MDLQKILNQSFEKLVESGKIEEAMEKNLESCIGGIVRDLFIYSGEIRKSLEDHIKANLNIDTKQIPLTAYSQSLVNMVNEALEKSFQEDGEKQIKKITEKMMTMEIPKEIKISEIVEKFIESWVKYDEDKRDYGFEFTFHFIQKWPNSDTLKHCYLIYLDEKPDKEPRECEYQLNYDIEDQEIDDFEIYGKKASDTTYMNTRGYGIKAWLFRLWAAKPKVINDASEVETGI